MLDMVHILKNIKYQVLMMKLMMIQEEDYKLNIHSNIFRV